MSRIRVDPSDLRRASEGIRKTAEAILAAGEDAIRAAQHAPGYEGQLGPPVYGLVADLQAEAKALAERLLENSDSLLHRADAFEEADGQSMAGMESVLRGIEEWVERERHVWPLGLEFPSEDVSRIMRLANLLDDGSVNEDPGGGRPWWAPIVLWGAGAWAAFDSSVGSAVRHFLGVGGAGGDDSTAPNSTGGQPGSVGPTSIQPLFYDKDAYFNGAASADIAVGSPPYQLDSKNPNDPTVPLEGGGPAWWLQVFSLGTKLAAPYASADYLKHLQPNVHVDLYYATYQGGKFGMPGLTIDNRSNEGIWIERVTASGPGLSVSLVPATSTTVVGRAYMPPSVPHGESAVIPLETRMPEHASVPYIDVQVWLKSGDRVYIPSWRIWVNGKVGGLP